MHCKLPDIAVLLFERKKQKQKVLLTASFLVCLRVIYTSLRIDHFNLSLKVESEIELQGVRLAAIIQIK